MICVTLQETDFVLRIIQLFDFRMETASKFREILYFSFQTTQTRFVFVATRDTPYPAPLGRRSCILGSIWKGPKQRIRRLRGLHFVGCLRKKTITTGKRRPVIGTLENEMIGEDPGYWKVHKPSIQLRSFMSLNYIPAAPMRNNNP